MSCHIIVRVRRLVTRLGSPFSWRSIRTSIMPKWARSALGSATSEYCKPGPELRELLASALEILYIICQVHLYLQQSTGSSCYMPVFCCRSEFWRAVILATCRVLLHVCFFAKVSSLLYWVFRRHKLPMALLLFPDLLFSRLLVSDTWTLLSKAQLPLRTLNLPPSQLHRFPVCATTTRGSNNAWPPTGLRITPPPSSWRLIHTAPICKLKGSVTAYHSTIWSQTSQISGTRLQSTIWPQTSRTPGTRPQSTIRPLNFANLCHGSSRCMIGDIVCQVHLHFFCCRSNLWHMAVFCYMPEALLHICLFRLFSARSSFVDHIWKVWHLSSDDTTCRLSSDTTPYHPSSNSINIFLPTHLP